MDMNNVNIEEIVKQVLAGMAGTAPAASASAAPAAPAVHELGGQHHAHEVDVRHQHHHGVLLAELVLDHKRVGAGAQVRVGLAVLVGEHGVALTQKRGNDERQHEDESRDAHLRQHLAHVLERGHEQPMPRLVDELVQRKRDRRQEHHDGEEAEHDALHQVDAKIGAIWNCMNARAAKPNSVVTALAAMVDSDLRIAKAMARSTFGVR